MADWRDDPITERQIKAINLINSVLGYRFSAKTKGRASVIIGDHYENAKSMRDRGLRMNKITNRQMASKVLQEVGPWED